MEFKKTFWDDVVQPTGEVDENCTFESIESDRGLYAHCLKIRELSYKTGSLISEVKAFIHVDDGAAKFIEKQSIFSDPRLFLLERIREVFMSQKIVAAGLGCPEITKMASRDSARNAISYIEIHAEVFFPTGDPSIPVANYCNTHIRDQMRKVCEVNPSAKPLESVVISRVAEIIEDRQVKNAALLLARKKANEALPEAISSVNLFIDETGDISYKSANEFYGVCGTTIKTEKLDVVRSKLRAVVAKHWSQAPIDFTLRTSLLPKRGTNWNGSQGISQGYFWMKSKVH